MAEEPVKVKDFPLAVRVLFDVIMLRSTPITAVFWCGFLLITAAHIAWSCGLLQRYGLDGGFLRVSDQAVAKQETENRLAGVEQKTETRIKAVEGKIDWQLKLTLTRELRDTTAALCKARGPGERAGLQAYLDQLVEEYNLLTGKVIAQPPCPQ